MNRVSPNGMTANGRGYDFGVVWLLQNRSAVEIGHTLYWSIVPISYSTTMNYSHFGTCVLL